MTAVTVRPSSRRSYHLRLEAVASSSEPPTSVGLACRPVGAWRRHLVKLTHANKANRQFLPAAGRAPLNVQELRCEARVHAGVQYEIFDSYPTGKGVGHEATVGDGATISSGRIGAPCTEEMGERAALSLSPVQSIGDRQRIGNIGTDRKAHQDQNALTGVRGVACR